jgi:hypothetical protein
VVIGNIILHLIQVMEPQTKECTVALRAVTATTGTMTSTPTMGTMTAMGTVSQTTMDEYDNHRREI